MFFARCQKLCKQENSFKQTRVNFFYSEKMTSFLNYVSATLRTFLRGAAHFLKADMESYIPLETAAISFSEPISKTGYELGVCHGWYHLHGQTRAARIKNWELQNEKFLPIAGLELTTPDSQVQCLIH